MLSTLLQMKQNEAAAFVETIKGPQWGGEESTVAVNVDPGMLAAMQRATLISPGWLAACTATMGTSLNSMAVLAANNNTMQVGQLSSNTLLSVVHSTLIPSHHSALSFCANVTTCLPTAAGEGVSFGRQQLDSGVCNHVILALPLKAQQGPGCQKSALDNTELKTAPDSTELKRHHGSMQFDSNQHF